MFRYNSTKILLRKSIFNQIDFLNKSKKIFSIIFKLTKNNRCKISTMKFNKKLSFRVFFLNIEKIQ